MAIFYRIHDSFREITTILCEYYVNKPSTMMIPMEANDMCGDDFTDVCDALGWLG